MNKLHIAILTVVFSLVGSTAWAGVNSSLQGEGNKVEDSQEATATVHYINAPRFVRPLIEKWIEEYKKVDPRANFAIAKNAESRGKSELGVQLGNQGVNSDLAKHTVYFAEYAILPIAAKNSDAAKQLVKQELKAKDIKTLFFEKDDFEKQDKNEKKAASYVVYTGNGNLSVAAEFASHYGKDVASFRGKRIVGDDLFLNTAVSKDPQGIAINAIPNIYDLNTRKLKSDLVVLPLDVDKSLRTAFLDGATIDDVIRALEANDNSEVPVERIGFSYQGNDASITNFIAWVLAEGENYNHDFGLLRLNAKLLAQQVQGL